MTTTVTVYNMGGTEILTRVSLNRAITLLFQEKATILDSVEGETFGDFPKPRAIALVRYIYAKWKYDTTGRVPFHKKAVLRRDHFKCAYCGGVATTVDHVIPKSHGQPLSWLNAVAACFPCNNKKDDRTPQEAGMKLRFQPYVPKFHEVYSLTDRR